MPNRAPRLCGCGKTVPYGQTCQCQRAREKDRQSRRPSARERGYDTEWEKAAKAYLAEPGHGRCVHCGKPATVVDHRVSIKEAPHLRMDRTNWQPLCRRCNTRKAIKQEGAFGNRPIKPGVVMNFDPLPSDPRPNFAQEMTETGFFIETVGED